MVDTPDNIELPNLALYGGGFVHDVWNNGTNNSGRYIYSGAFWVTGPINRNCQEGDHLLPLLMGAVTSTRVGFDSTEPKPDIHAVSWVAVRNGGLGLYVARQRLNSKGQVYWVQSNGLRALPSSWISDDVRELVAGLPCFVSQFGTDGDLHGSVRFSNGGVGGRFSRTVEELNIISTVTRTELISFAGTILRQQGPYLEI